MAEHEQLNFDDELRRSAESVPFIPFDILTTSGEKYEVRERIQFAMGPTAIVLVLPRTGIQLVRKNQVTAIHVHEAV